MTKMHKKIELDGKGYTLLDDDDPYDPEWEMISPSGVRKLNAFVNDGEKAAEVLRELAWDEHKGCPN